MAVQIQIRHDTAANWTAANPILAVGEMGIETDTRKIKIGDGVTNWNTLLYFEQQTGPQGDPGEGVPVGGTTGQALIKNSNSDYDTIWSNDPYARANHTGTQTASTISDFNSTVTSTINTTVNKTFVDNLNVDADTLDGIDSLGFATAAQGTTAETAVQPGDFTNTLAQIDAGVDDVQAAKAASATDTVSGRLLKVGDFGVGSAAPVVGTIPTSSGFYQFTTASTGGPEAATGYNILNVRGVSDLGTFSIAANLARPGNTFHVRNRTDSAWHELLHTGNTIVDVNGFIKEA